MRQKHMSKAQKHYEIKTLADSKLNCIKYNFQSKKVGKGQELIQSSTTTDPDNTRKSKEKTILHHKREPKGQPFPSR